MIRPDQLQRLEELLSQPDMVPCMPLLRADVAALLAEHKARAVLQQCNEHTEKVKADLLAKYPVTPFPPHISFFD